MKHNYFPVLLILLLAGCTSGRMAVNVPVETPAGATTAETNGPVATAPDGNDPAEVLPRFELESWPTFDQSIAAGTRTRTGVPGPDYWQQEAAYDIDVQLFPDEKRLEGTTHIRYTNNSPNTLQVLALQLIQNLHKEGVPRLESVEVTDGMELERVAVEGRALDEGITGRNDPGYVVNGTNLTILPHNSIAPGESVELDFQWTFDIPQQGAGARMGYSSDNLFFIAYFYPVMHVYDDLFGWFGVPFRGNAEFYFGYGDYDLSITAPQDWVILSTGRLQNAESVLQPDILELRESAYHSDEPIMIMTPEDDGDVTVQDDEWLTWEFTADDVRDVAFTATRESFWEAARTEVGDRNGDGIIDYTGINSIWRPSAPLWSEMTRYQQHAIHSHSNFTGLSYAYPHMTAVEGTGIIGGGMEFPMMTLMGPYTQRGDTALYAVTAHELAHMWVPMMISTNERRYGWMDEGMTVFLENQAKADFYGIPFYASDAAIYLNVARRGLEGPIMRWSDYHYPGPAYGIASYMKPATMLRALRGLLGEDTFLEAYRAFHDRWAFKHPYPPDLFNTFEAVSGRDLDWFWRTWFYETWTLDQAVASVQQRGGETMITIENQDRAVMPVYLAITFEDGETVSREIPVDVWLDGGETAMLTIEQPVARVEIDPEAFFPDIDRSDNVWER